jgi:hypothetical protein
MVAISARMISPAQEKIHVPDVAILPGLRKHCVARMERSDIRGGTRTWHPPHLLGSAS